jgi:hypothetical protein
MGFTHRAFVAAAVGFAASALAGCGSTGRLLSASESNQLSTQLNTVSQALSEGDCQTAESALSAFEGRLAALNGVNSTLVSNLNQGATTIQQLTSAKCASYAQTKPKRPKTTPRAKTTTTTATQTTLSDTTTTSTYTNTYTQPTYSAPSTSTTDGTSPTGTGTDTTGTDTTATTYTSPNGGQGLGAGGTTTTTNTYGGDNGNGNGGIPGNGGGN